MEYQKDVKKWDTESSTLEGNKAREKRAYEYQLDFYTRYNGRDKKNPDDFMKYLNDLIDKPYTGPEKTVSPKKKG